MGQSSSTQRDRRHSTPSEYFRSFHANRARPNRNEEMNNGHNLEQTGEYPPQSGAEIHSGGSQTGAAQPNSTAEIWQPNIPIDEQRQMRTIQEENGSQYEPSQREYRSAIFARMAARRQTAISRLGSRFLPNSVIRGLLSSEEETPAEGHAHRHGIVSRSIPRSETTHSSARFSPFSSPSSRGVSRRRSLRGPYFIPRNDPSTLSDAAHPSAYLDAAAESSPEPTRSSWRRSARLHRVRNSLSGPITHMFGQSSSNMPGQEPGATIQPPLDPVVSADPNGFLPYSGSMDSQMDFDEPHELDSVEPAVGSTRPTSPMSSQSSQGPSGLRQFPALLRGRPSRVPRREEQTPLSRVLQLAAAAIAAQLSGTAGPVMPNIQALGNDGLDGSLENFIQSLQHATSAQATPNEAGNVAGDSAPPTPVNFLRVFRFANSDGARPAGQPNRSTGDSEHADSNGNGMDVDSSADGPEGRTVTLVVVGVRSVPSGNGPSGGDQPGNAGTGLDALLRLPFLTPGNLSRNPDNGSGIPRSEGRPRFSSIRPQSEATSGLSASNDSSQQGVPGSLRRMSDTGSRAPLGSLSSAPSVLSESPPGPHPPPSTPAEAGLSNVSSSASTPSRRPSAASAMPPSTLPHWDSNRAIQPTVEDGIPLNARQRRRSDSEYARHRDLGSGAVRRNGVVEPDNATPSTGRSWLIYVVGTNLSENHPAFATPSLFTDNPTYEDMILLSSLLGPVKPPVASQEDLSTAGGVFRLVEYAGSLVAEALEGAGTIQVPEGERCLICLSDYEVAEELRQLNKCQHLFHRDCIDQVLDIESPSSLTTGNQTPIMDTPVRLTVLISGNGSNLQAVIDKTAQGELSTQIVRVISNRKDAYGLERARQASIPTQYHNLVKYKKQHPPTPEGIQAAREEYDAELARLVLADKPEMVACLGFMHVLSPRFLEPLEKAKIQIINLHPALPGAFNGANAIERAHAAWLEGKIDKTGVMIHKVISEVDMGTPILVREIPFVKGEDEDLHKFEQKVHEVEWEVVIEGVKLTIQEVKKAR
ncbi:hypothetical protein BO70DRAFT_297225 [Aspergillus heteromorphus CBS 117.55]|uniref:Phosphoribosylglycinamide formyltransferase n=1 Tax=Aspergillus heteromorphus CBS 117.55 TaxID=1448321 RepID=A0A317VJJ3_9EURO|nr:uncharacterized protein BO70DRAFT_297225 [Aspergillus heteromorphus CBS 117.55]PWY73599.1 hypothetical protein BO70DRAFT_297225 [Aspergillus heteromorphus CBS 117.55]